MTNEEVKNLPWHGEEKFALVNKETAFIGFASDDIDFLRETVDVMGEDHPLAKKLILVERSTGNTLKL